MHWWEQLIALVVVLAVIWVLLARCDHSSADKVTGEGPVLYEAGGPVDFAHFVRDTWTPGDRTAQVKKQWPLQARTFGVLYRPLAGLDLVRLAYGWCDVPCVTVRLNIHDPARRQPSA